MYYNVKMKKHIKRLICYSLIALVGINFNTEARLPKYMAQKAAELLIKESKLGIKDEILNLGQKKIEDLLCSEKIKSLVNIPVGMGIETKKIKGIVNEILNDIKSKVTDKETFEKALPSSSIKNTLSEKIKGGVQGMGTEKEKKLEGIKKEIIEELKCFIYASKLVDFLYTTEKRQHLANWMKNRVYKGKVSDRFFLIKDEKETESFTRLFNDFDEGLIDDTYFREFANWHFPCWTGTLTCFMLKEPSLAQRIFQDKTWRNKGYNKEYLTEYSLMEMIHTEDLKKFKKCPNRKNFIKEYNYYFKSPQKLIRILFLLELMDEWKNVQQVIGNDTISEPTLPNNYNYDPYECVPVPNTAYFLNAQQVKNDSERIKLQGSCMVSVIRNLLCILCRDENGEYKKNDSLRSEVDKYIRNFNDTKIRDFIPGTTSPAILGEFAENILPEIKVSYQPTLDLFVCTLNDLLSDKIDNAKVIIPSPKSYVMNSEYHGIDYADLIGKILRKITGHGESLSTEILRKKQNTSTRTDETWYNYEIVIKDEIVNKKVTIDIRKIGDGHHIEITDIKGMEKDENEILEK